MKTITANSLADTQKLAAELASAAKAGDVFALIGTLGTGKTAFSKAFVNSLLEVETDVISPTFNLLQTYISKSGTEIWHYDLYRLKTTSEIYELAIEEAFDTAIVLIEWPEIIENILPRGTKFIEITMGETENSRNFKIWSKQ
jgi:tRNA threonylcarbamoyladenosine biosynthesis protein TsaE